MALISNKSGSSPSATNVLPGSKNLAYDGIIQMLKATATQNNPKDDFTRPEVIGQGGFGKVFRAHNRKTNEKVAVKTIGLVPENADMKYLLPEIEMLKECSHVNIVEYRSHYVTDHRLWIELELIDGEHLHKLAHRLHLEEKEIAAISQESLQAIEYLHQKKIVHRDIKGNNVMIAQNGAVKLLDFGLAAKEEAVDPETWVGTTHFMAPEIILQEKYGCNVDIWAFGIMVVQMIVGSTPYYMKQGYEAMRLIVKYGKPHIPDEENYSLNLQSFIDNCLQVDRVKRSSAKNLLRHSFLLDAATREEVGALVTCYREKLVSRYRT